MSVGGNTSYLSFCEAARIQDSNPDLQHLIRNLRKNCNAVQVNTDIFGKQASSTTPFSTYRGHTWPIDLAIKIDSVGYTEIVLSSEQVLKMTRQLLQSLSITVFRSIRFFGVLVHLVLAFESITFTVCNRSLGCHALTPIDAFGESVA